MLHPSPKRRQRPAWLRPLLSLLAGLLIGTIALAVVMVPPAGWISHDVTTGSASGYPDLTARQYDMPVEQATRVAAQLAGGLGGWQVAYLDAAAGEMQADVRALPVLPRQTVTVAVRAAGPGSRYSKVLIRSRSAWGLGDFGINARNIRALQTAMDGKLPLAP